MLFSITIKPTDTNGSRINTTKLWSTIVPRLADIEAMTEDKTMKNIEPVIIRVRYISTNNERSWLYFLILLL
jgi:hypothetical protein